jgi:hypothetical protein
MATRSHISVKVGNIYKTVYCHFDGYPSYNGRILLSNYNSQELAEKLINGGDMSSLHETHPHYYEDSSYVESEQRPSLVEDYLYVFENGKWHILAATMFTDYQELTEEIIAEDY